MTYVSGKNIPAVWPWFQPPPPAGPYDAPGLAPGPRFNPTVGHAHLYRPQPNPGAPAFAYDVLGLVEYTPIGAGESNREYLRPEQPGSAFAALGLRTTGVGGLSQGQVITAPLIVPDALQLDTGGDETPFSTG